MILIHLSVKGNAAILDGNNILFAEEIEGKNEKGEKVIFTRIYLKTPLPGENETGQLDVKESVERIMKSLR